MVTLDGTCHCPSLQYQPAYNTRQLHSGHPESPRKKENRKGREDTSCHLPIASKAFRSRELGEGTALGPGDVQPSVPTPSVTHCAKSCPLQCSHRCWPLRYFVPGRSHRPRGRGERSLLIGAASASSGKRSSIRDAAEVGVTLH